MNTDEILSNLIIALIPLFLVSLLAVAFIALLSSKFKIVLFTFLRKPLRWGFFQGFISLLKLNREIIERFISWGVVCLIVAVLASFVLAEWEEYRYEIMGIVFLALSWIWKFGKWIILAVIIVYLLNQLEKELIEKISDRVIEKMSHGSKSTRDGE